ncbi:MAG: DeoR/GlpR transcriptional regulator [Clostridia bacterium]|nr:DeoR/GlpR transcriptional regulator [Clostridia bacterium]
MNSRQQDILKLTEKHGEITIKDLSRLLGVTEMTIHRDLDYLEDNKLIHKKRGAAVYLENKEAAKISFYAEEKRIIGKKAASLLKEGQSVIFDNSTTAAECARYLDDSLKLTCYTTSLEIADIIARSGKHILYCSGGYYFPDSHGFVGSHAESYVSKIKADVAIVGASGISLEKGITNPYPMHNNLQRAIIKSAKECILLADHSKFERIAMEETCSLSDINTVITDDGVSPEILEKYKKHIKIIVAGGK